MKKILFFCAALIAAATVSAEIKANYTVQQAYDAAVALGSGVTGTDSVTVTGYVTNTTGTISKGQQTFWMDDEKGTTKTFEAYWANLPQEMVDAKDPLVVGDKVTIKGFLINWSGTTMEMKNCDVVVLEHTVPVIDTVTASVCEAVGEALALASNAQSEDKFDVTGVVTIVNDPNTTYKNQTFYFACTEAGDNKDKTLQAYNAYYTGEDGFAQLGDTVRVIGYLMNYNGTQAEFTGAEFTVIGRGTVKVDTIAADVATATAAGLLLDAGGYSDDVYEVTGYVDSIAYAYSEKYGNMSFFMCDDLTAPTYTFEAYKAKVSQDIPVGTKVTVTGRLKNYVKNEASTIEIEQGETTIISVPTALDEINVNTINAQKVMLNGQMVIIRNNVLYNALGAEL